MSWLASGEVAGWDADSLLYDKVATIIAPFSLSQGKTRWPRTDEGDAELNLPVAESPSDGSSLGPQIEHEVRYLSKHRCQCSDSTVAARGRQTQ